MLGKLPIYMINMSMGFNCQMEAKRVFFWCPSGWYMPVYSIYSKQGHNGHRKRRAMHFDLFLLLPKFDDNTSRDLSNHHTVALHSRGRKKEEKYGVWIMTHWNGRGALYNAYKVNIC